MRPVAEPAGSSFESLVPLFEHRVIDESFALGQAQKLRVQRSEDLIDIEVEIGLNLLEG